MRLAVERRLEPVAGQADLDRVRARFDAVTPASEPTLLLARCLPTAAFTRRDALLPGFEDARAAARRRGFEPVLRPVGGHLAAYDEECLVLHLWAPQASAGDGITDRFTRYGQALADALTAIGMRDVRVGAVPGEYCDGEWSVNVAGRQKLVGTGQRITRRGYLFSAVVTVRDVEPLRRLLIDAYAALGLAFDPATVGSVPQVDVAQVADAVVDSFLDLFKKTG